MVLEKTLESPLDCKEIQPVHPKGDQSWVFTGRTDAEAPILWPADVKSQLIGKDPDDRKDWRQEKKGMTEDEIVGWHHWLNGHEFEQALGDGEGKRNLMCCSLWGRKESDTTEWLNWTKLRPGSLEAELETRILVQSLMKEQGRRHQVRCGFMWALASAPSWEELWSQRCSVLSAHIASKKHTHASQPLPQRSRGCGVVTPRNLRKNQLQVPKGTSQVRIAMGDVSRRITRNLNKV